ncbi:MAG TPA: SAM-dependent methyltransferase [Clostridiales bacterium]|nr:SAM-dependent methyltransferase [Clostridiales bacterium]
MSRPLFSLDNRLALCAEYVQKGAAVADIGTDHGYLPVWLAKTGKIHHAIAADINPLPLEHGLATIKKYHAEDMVETRLSDGLQAINPQEADNIIIAGMGGELIAAIIHKASWLQDNTKTLILQPMSRSHLLREYLYKNGFDIVKERAVKADGRLYSVMVATYTGAVTTGIEVKSYIGKLSPKKQPLDKAYIENKISALSRKAHGIALSGDVNMTATLQKIIKELKEAAK